jgi:hypothetical protein
MKPVSRSELHLDQLQQIAKITPGKAQSLLECCVWCLDNCEHTNGVNLDVRYDKHRYSYSLQWDETLIDKIHLHSSYNENDATEWGAEAIALPLSLQQTEYTAVLRATSFTGIDYWLGHTTEDPNNPFNKSCRLEISGILKENHTNKVDRRVKIKTNQTKPTDHLTPVYVVVVEFGQPFARMVFKNANSQ